MAFEEKETVSHIVVTPLTMVGAPALRATPIFEGNGRYVIFRILVDGALMNQYIYLGTSPNPSPDTGIPLNVGTVDEFATKSRSGQNWYAISTNGAARLVIIEKMDTPKL